MPSMAAVVYTVASAETGNNKPSLAGVMKLVPTVSKRMMITSLCWVRGVIPGDCVRGNRVGGSDCCERYGGGILRLGGHDKEPPSLGRKARYSVRSYHIFLGCVVMECLVALMWMLTQSVLYFVCKAYHGESIDGNLGEYQAVKNEDIESLKPLNI
ncbi:hypothetical protein SUGI_1197270 [Cryptomeria japonica]|nr:hypothetical protein SUGI_1197270 [Cryptomeria japonica]